MSTLLIADDEQTFLNFMVRLLQKEHELHIARNWNEVLEKFEANIWRLNATILDVHMPGLDVDPFSMVEKLLKSNRTVPMIIISGQDIDLGHEFLRMGIFRYHRKPIDMIDFKLTIQSALEYNRVLRAFENYDKKEKDEIKYYQKLLNINLNELRERIKRYDNSTGKTPIMIRAEAGTYPQRLAKLINYVTEGKIFFNKVCNKNLKNLIPHNLQDGDTLFLEGIEHLGEEELNFLLNLIKEILSNTQEPNLPDFRLIVSLSIKLDSSTNPVIDEIVKRLSDLEFRVEPLRLRKHELKNVIDLIFEKKKREIFSVPQEISEDLYQILIEYNWPLNYAELELIIEGLLITCTETMLMPKHLHQLDFTNIANSKYPTLDDMVDEHIKKALRLTMGNKSRAAKMLGITPKTLYSRIRN
ncbi:MAG: response regulator [Calditrichaeota bacterium]|nr:MAG: response regulator [Calditrichota bacterium]